MQGLPVVVQLVLATTLNWIVATEISAAYVSQLANADKTDFLMAKNYHNSFLALYSHTLTEVYNSSLGVHTCIKHLTTYQIHISTQA